jgi:hypothetical protein
MKTASSFLAVLTTVIALFTISPRAHAAAVDFSKLYGAYKCTYSLETSGTVISGNVRTSVTRQGSKANLQIAGSGAVPGSPGVLIALFGNLVFAPNHFVKTDNALLAYYLMVPSSSHFTSSTGRFTFRFAASGGFITSDITYTLRFSGKKISIVGTGTISGSTPIKITLRGTKVGS